MKYVCITAAATVGLATASFAGSAAYIPQAAVVAAPAMAATDWSGFYAGGLVSFDSGNFGFHFGEFLFPNNILDATTGFGGFVGYNRQVNKLVFGGELAYTMGDIYAPSSPEAYYGDRIDLKARVGYSFGPVLLYGVVGYSFSELQTDSFTFPSSGLNYGVGVDVMVTQRLFVGVEYLMRDLSGAYEDSPFRADGNLDSISIRAGFRF